METIVPKCINNNTCSHVYNVKTCKMIPFLCSDDQCSCHSLHQKCATNIKWRFMKQSLSNKIKKSSSQLAGYFTQINDLYNNTIKQIEKSFEQIKNISESIGLSELERDFTELNGGLISRMQVEQDIKSFQVRNIDKQIKQIKKQATILIEMLEGLTKFNAKEEEKIFHAPSDQPLTSFKLGNKITQDISTLSSFFTRKIVSINLLYRASENNFQVSKFWDKCDNRKNTITILTTQFGCIIGGYSPLPWNKNKSVKWQTDSSMQLFIFSLTNKHKLTLIKGRQQNAIQYNSSFGPIFGDDIGIYDKSNLEPYSYACPGYSYNFNNQYVYNTQQSWKKFSGNQRDIVLRQKNGKYTQQCLNDRIYNIDIILMYYRYYEFNQTNWQQET